MIKQGVTMENSPTQSDSSTPLIFQSKLFLSFESILKSAIHIVHTMKSSPSSLGLKEATYKARGTSATGR